ncbi:MAG: phospholipase D family protein [Rhizobium sp.]|nr:phospholipase D family protein [Rhizobium sp.]MBW8320932.1 phospholipase D family protein [Rhizobium sp.]
MKSVLVYQPVKQLGSQLHELLDENEDVRKIVFVSAFVALRSVLRLRDIVLFHKEEGASVKIIVGIDLGGTSKETLEEIMLWSCDSYVFHNPNPRSTFHPKIYLIEKKKDATLFVGSNNLTDGGFYTNYEVASKYRFKLPAELSVLKKFVSPVADLMEPKEGDLVKKLTKALINVLSQRGDLPTEVEVRRRKRDARRTSKSEGPLPPNPFTAQAPPSPPLLPKHLRDHDAPGIKAPPEPLTTAPTPVVAGVTGALVWRKVLPATDALQVNPGSKHVGGVRLTQAKFESPHGGLIDQTQYFRQLFSDYEWEQETGRKRASDQEHTFVPMRLTIRGRDYGVHNFEIGHKPSGEAGQDNYTTILRWGRQLTPLIQDLNIEGATLSLYEGDEEGGFLIDIDDVA